MEEDDDGWDEVPQDDAEEDESDRERAGAAAAVGNGHRKVGSASQASDGDAPQQRQKHPGSSGRDKAEQRSGRVHVLERLGQGRK
jgi:hypothetical protein